MRRETPWHNASNEKAASREEEGRTNVLDRKTLEPWAWRWRFASRLRPRGRRTRAEFDPAKYPDWSGQWRRPESGPSRYDPSRAPGLAQQAPLTPEFQAIFEAGLADQKEGGSGTNLTSSCLPSGLPRDMSGNQGLEFIVTPMVTYVLFDNAMPRRIYTDGRDWPRTRSPRLPATRSASGASPGRMAATPC